MDKELSLEKNESEVVLNFKVKFKQKIVFLLHTKPENCTLTNDVD
jgi:hypothetical protein